MSIDYCMRIFVMLCTEVVVDYFQKQNKYENSVRPESKCRFHLKYNIKSLVSALRMASAAIHRPAVTTAAIP